MLQEVFMKSYDAIIIGFGKGGKTLAGYMAKQGKRVAMIEKSNQMYGGTCINEGCIPSKSLIIQADKQSYGQAVERKEALIEKLRKKNFDKLDSLELVDVITAKASFVSDHEVHVQGAGVDETLYGDYIFLNTGSVSNIPNIKGIHEARHIYTSAEMMKERSLPAKLAIIGGGYIGLEFSSMYARYGSTVTVFEHGSRLVKREDQDVADEIQKVLEKQGVGFVFESSVKEFANEGEQVVITYDDAHGIQQKLTVDAVLLAAGRSANTKQLHLENTGVKLDQRGNVIVNEYLQTSVPHIYAMGDVKGVGLSEQEAREQGYAVKTVSMPAAAIPRANVISQPDGLLMAVIDTKTDQILGCVLFCAESEEVINFVQLAMNQQLTYQEVGNHIFTHPTMSEALNDLFS